MKAKLSVYIGFDAREAAAFAVAAHSARRTLLSPIPIFALDQEQLREDGLYWRETRVDEKGQMWDAISEAPMSTEFSITRFLTPYMANRGWALFMDCDVMLRTDVSRLFDLADSTKALMCVQHPALPEQGIKMDHQLQVPYRRKNWSSVMLFNCDHPANRRLTLEAINTLPGRDLHRFCWLEDEEIGELPASWNWLVNHSAPDLEPDLVHFTDGGPWFSAYSNVPYADEWRANLRHWARFAVKDGLAGSGHPLRGMR